MLSSSFDGAVHGAAADIFANLARQMKLDDFSACCTVAGAAAAATAEAEAEGEAWDARPEALATEGLASYVTAVMLCELISRLLRSGEALLSAPMVEALGRLTISEENEPHIMVSLE